MLVSKDVLRPRLKHGSSGGGEAGVGLKFEQMLNKPFQKLLNAFKVSQN